jgi:hypothetical protein
VQNRAGADAEPANADCAVSLRGYATGRSLACGFAMIRRPCLGRVLGRDSHRQPLAHPTIALQKCRRRSMLRAPRPISLSAWDGGLDWDAKLDGDRCVQIHGLVGSLERDEERVANGHVGPVLAARVLPPSTDGVNSDDS